MKKYIDVEDLRIELMLTFPAYALMMSDIVDELPTAEDVVPVIRCSDCENYKDERCRVANHHVSGKENCMTVFGAKLRGNG